MLPRFGNRGLSVLLIDRSAFEFVILTLGEAIGLIGRIGRIASDRYASIIRHCRRKRLQQRRCCEPVGRILIKTCHTWAETLTKVLTVNQCLYKILCQVHPGVGIFRFLIF